MECQQSLRIFFPNNNKLFSQLMNNVQLKLQDEIEEDSQLLEDKKMLERYCEKDQENLLM